MLVAALFLVSSALAWEQSVNATGDATAWRGMPGPVTIESGGVPAGLDEDAAEAAIEDAFLAWNDVYGADVAFTVASSSDGVNPVRWERDWPWDADVLAMTSTWSDLEGAIYAFQVDINARDPHWGFGDHGAMDLQNAITHEAGHALGLDHPADQPDATMYATAATGEVLKRDLHWDDEEAIRTVYPGADAGRVPSEIDVMELIGCSNVGVLPALFPALVGLVALRRGRRTSC